MKRASKNIVKRLSARRRHQWKYVSPRRRRFGLFFLAFLLALFYGVWYVTNDSFIRSKTESELEEQMATDVDIESAEFDIQEGIRLQGVRVWDLDPVKGDPFLLLYSEEVVLKFSTWKALISARIDPHDIFCIRPVVNMDEQRFGNLRERISRKSGSLSESYDSLPRIHLSNGYLRRIEPKEEGWNVVYEQPLNCKMTADSKGVYRIAVGKTIKDVSSINAIFEYDVRTGEIRDLSGEVGPKGIGLLPKKMREWVERYDPRWGKLLVHKSEGQDLNCVLEGLSFKLPPDQGGVSFSNVNGRLVFREESIGLNNITGVLENAGAARFTLNGNYSGYDSKSPFEVSIDIRDLELPESMEGPLREFVETIQEKFQPRGKADVTMAWRRGKDGKYSGKGKMLLKGVSLSFYRFPLPVYDVNGTIDFTDKGADKVEFAARRGKTVFSFNGVDFRREKGKILYSAKVTAKKLPLDDALYKALDEKQRRIWDSIKPAGHCALDTRVSRTDPDKPTNIEVDMKFGGFASLQYGAFPFPLQNLSGSIMIRGDTLTIPWIQSREGDMTCTISGNIANLDRKLPLVKLDIEAIRVPLDKDLFGVLGRRAQELVSSLHCTGLADRITAKVSRSQKDKAVQYTASAKVKDLSFKYDAFPLKVTGAMGWLKVSPDKIVIDSLSGSHGKAAVTIGGTLSSSGDKMEYDLDLGAKNLSADRELYDILPDKIKKIWDSFALSGTADVSLKLRSSEDEGRAYHMTLDAKGMDIRPESFPYPFRNVTGRIVVTPKSVTLEKVMSGEEKKAFLIDGRIDLGPKVHEVNLVLSARNLPVDKTLFAAIPPAAAPLFALFREGGAVDMDITSLVFRLPSSPATRPASRPTLDMHDWSAQGTVVMRNSPVDLGFAPAAVTGRLSGKISQTAGKMSIRADAKLNSLRINKHSITRLTGSLVKSPDSDILHVRGLKAEIHGGQIIGEGDIRLAKPLTYTVSSEMKDIDINRLVNLDIKKPEDQLDVSGKLTGSLALKVVSGKKSSRLAQGELQISRAKMYKMPVIVDLLTVVYLALPGESAFNRGFVTYHLRNNTMRFSEIYLTGANVSVLGSGTLDIKTDKLDLTFLTGPPGKLPRIEDLATEVLRGFSRELVEIRVKGTLRKPKMDTVPLRSLDTLLRRLLEPSLKSR